MVELFMQIFSRKTIKYATTIGRLASDGRYVWVKWIYVLWMKRQTSNKMVLISMNCFLFVYCRCRIAILIKNERTNERRKENERQPQL